MLSFGMVSCGSEPSSERSLLIPDRETRFYSVTDEFGPLVISREALRKGSEDATLAQKPWSSWYFPINEDIMFKGKDSPLSKYDEFARRYDRRDSKAAAFEESTWYLYDPNADGWQGHCDAWALASVVEPEPVGPVEVKGVRFSTGDLKALALKAYDLDAATQKSFFEDGILRFYGERAGESPRTEDPYDLYPDQFHRFVQAQIFERKRPFIMDRDPGFQVWNHPVFAAYFTYERTGDPHELKVYASVSIGSYVQEYDYVGTKSVNLDYSYSLYGHYRDDGSFEAVFGEWTKRDSLSLDSRNDHPDFVVSVPASLPERKSRNKEIDTKLVDVILKAASR